MRRTLLLVVALPVLLALSGGGAGGDADAPDAPPSAGPAAPAPRSTAAPSPLPDRVVGAPPVGEGDPLEASDRTAGADGETGPLVDVTTPDPGPRPEADPVTGLLLAGAEPAAGEGPLVRYSLQLDPSLGFLLDDVAATVSAALLDDRSWARTHTIERVADLGAASIRIVIASPAAVDAMCARAGLNTAGIFSCWNGRVAALNGWRWEVGARGFDDVETYRTYLVNHEFGHGLGYGHVGCPATGAPAPVMMQQSKGLGGCAANGWPYP